MGLTSGCSGICVGEASLAMDVKAFAVQNDGCREFPGDPV